MGEEVDGESQVTVHSLPGYQSPWSVGLGEEGGAGTHCNSV